VPPHTDVPVIDRLDAIAEQAAELPPHEHAGLAEVMRWSPLPRGAALFDTRMDFDACRAAPGCIPSCTCIQARAYP
jgi:hypothetical protein